jgi:hypothetical protein
MEKGQREHCDDSNRYENTWNGLMESVLGKKTFDD